MTPHTITKPISRKTRSNLNLTVSHCTARMQGRWYPSNLTSLSIAGMRASRTFSMDSAYEVLQSQKMTTFAQSPGAGNLTRPETWHESRITQDEILPGAECCSSSRTGCAFVVTLGAEGNHELASPELSPFPSPSLSGSASDGAVAAEPAALAEPAEKPVCTATRSDMSSDIRASSLLASKQFSLTVHKHASIKPRLAQQDCDTRSGDRPCIFLDCEGSAGSGEPLLLRSPSNHLEESFDLDRADLWSSAELLLPAISRRDSDDARPLSAHF